MATSSSAATLTPIRRRLLATEVYDQLLARILRGQIKVGGALPSERTLTSQLGVNRNVIREGLKRLEHSGLIEIRHGGATRVLDFRRSGGLDLLLPMLSSFAEIADPAHVLQATIELRAHLASSVARLAAERRKPAHLDVLRTHVRYMNEAASRDDMLARIGEDFWREVVAATDNVAMELAWSSIHRALTAAPETSPLLHADARVVNAHALLVDAIGKRDRDKSAEIAHRIAQPQASPTKKKRPAARARK